MRTNLRELAGPALFEATFVVLGVVLALAANEWRMTRSFLIRFEALVAKMARSPRS